MKPTSFISKKGGFDRKTDQIRTLFSSIYTVSRHRSIWYGSWKYWKANSCGMAIWHESDHKNHFARVSANKNVANKVGHIVQIRRGMPNLIPGKGKVFPKPSLMNLSVEEENLAAIPFAVLERRVGKKVGKIEINGSKTLPDGTLARVVWQV